MSRRSLFQMICDPSSYPCPKKFLFKVFFRPLQWGVPSCRLLSSRQMNTLKPWKVQPPSNIGNRFPSQRLTNDAISTKFIRSAAVRIISQISPQSVPTVTIPYTEVKDKTADLSGKIEQGFGSNGLGIPSILEVPGYTSLRRNHLQLALGHEPIELLVLCPSAGIDKD